MLTAIVSRLGWFAVAAIAAACLGVLAAHRGETINAVWVIAATLAIHLIG
jgi:carbon starvation protein